MSVLRLYLPSIVLCAWAAVIALVGIGRVLSLVALVMVSIAMKVQATELVRRLRVRQDRRDAARQ